MGNLSIHAVNIPILYYITRSIHKYISRNEIQQILGDTKGRQGKYEILPQAVTGRNNGQQRNDKIKSNSKTAKEKCSDDI
jgi:hypothetical protein